MAQAKAYDPLLVEHGERLNILRENLITEVKKIYDEMVHGLAQENRRADIFSNIDIYLKPGFDNNTGLMENLVKTSSIDLKRKITTAGPHKADVSFESKGLLIKDIFSRGEQKLLSILWSISQNIYLGRAFNLSPILLLDDLSSELDAEMLECFLPTLKYIENRFVFSNIVDPFGSKISINEQSLKKFHVEQLK
jgi:DNA replication and repair protein RecF